MNRDDIKGIMNPLPAMRGVVGEMVDAATKDRDRLSFIDGQKVYVEFGPDDRSVGNGYIAWDSLNGWEAMIVRHPGKFHEPCVEHELCTFREALDAFMHCRTLYIKQAEIK